MNNELFNKVKEINRLTKAKTDGQATGEDLKRLEELIDTLFTVEYTVGFKSIRDKDSNNPKNVFHKNIAEDVKVIKWKDNQLNWIYNKAITLYGQIDIIKKGILYKESLDIDAIFSVMLEKVCYLWKDNFEFTGEGQLVNYLKKRILGLVGNQWQKNNEVALKNNSKIESLDMLILQDEYVQERLENSNYEDKNLKLEFKKLERENTKTILNLSATDTYKAYSKNDDNTYTTYNEMFEKEFHYSDNEELRRIPDNERDYSEVYMCWSRRFWDGCNDHNGDLKILSSKDIDLHITEQQQLKFYISMWRSFLTKNQIEKIDKLIDKMETENFIKYNCGSVKNKDTYTYKNNSFSLDLEKVGSILFPKRKGNSNKDIYQFLNSCRSRLEKYLIENKKEYLMKDIPNLSDIA